MAVRMVAAGALASPRKHAFSPLEQQLVGPDGRQPRRRWRVFRTSRGAGQRARPPPTAAFPDVVVSRYRRSIPALKTVMLPCVCASPMRAIQRPNMFGLPPVTQALILVNLAFFFAPALGLPVPINALVLWPLGPYFYPWQLLTYGFLHGGLSHLLFNLFGLYMFGAEVEQVWGTKRFLNYYLFCVVSAALAQLVVSWLMGSGAPTLGASGGVFGLLIAFALLFPNRVIVPLIPPIPMRAPIFVALYGGVELFLGVTGTQGGVAHFAHLGGLAGGYLWIRIWGRGRSGGQRYR